MTSAPSFALECLHTREPQNRMAFLGCASAGRGPIGSPLESLDDRIMKTRRALSLDCRSCKCLPPIVAAG